MRWLLMKMIRGYQRFISPILSPRCRYYPTCSTYGLKAIEKHGAFKGGIMAFSRICRCNPFISGGFDYVPDHFKLTRNPEETCSCQKK